MSFTAIPWEVTNAVDTCIEPISGFDFKKLIENMTKEAEKTVTKMTEPVKKEEKMLYKNKYLNFFTVKRVHCSGDVTVVIWGDNSKTMVRCQNGEKFDPEKGIAMCFMKRAFGGKSVFNDAMKVMLDTAFNK